jgi:NAD(P)-dependent dehydrogenase (short-subunit alcohol dehydrogenase family)
MRRLTGKVAIVTGSAHGIGRASAMIMAREGAKVCVADINGEGAKQVAAEISRGGTDAISFQLDIGEEDQVRAMVAATVNAFGAVDVLQNTAAATSAEQFERDLLIGDMDVAVWDRAMKVTLRGTMLCCKHVLPHMLERESGSVINISSTAAMVGMTFAPAYGASKAGVHSVSQYLACQYGKYRIRANTIAPGIVLTPVVRRNSEAFLKVCLANNVLPYLGEPEDIGHVAAFLASDEARYLTGQCIPVDGGQIMHSPMFADLNRLSGGKLDPESRDEKALES